MSVFLESSVGVAIVPFWDAMRRQLLVESRVVKWLRQPARMQELVLAAFQEDGWPPRIDDPLPVSKDVDRNARLRDVVRRLNVQSPKQIVFYRDGTGQGICWRWAL